MGEDKRDVQLCRIARAMEEEKIAWGVGASRMLCAYGIAREYHDIDLMVCQSDVPRVDALLSAMGKKAPARENQGKYHTAFFGEYEIDGVDVDVMAGFALETEGGLYSYDFSPTDIAREFPLGREKIPLMAPEIWYVLYHMMERESKVRLLEAYFCKEAVFDRACIERLCLAKAMPEKVRGAIANFLATREALRR